MRGMKKGQTAMEYLMTYGWAILIIIIVAAALFALGVFNPGTFTSNTVTGLNGFNVPTGSWQLTSGGTFRIQMSNQLGSRINVTSVQATVGTTTATNTTNGMVLAPGAESPLVNVAMGTTYTANTAYNAQVVITYNNLDTGFSGFTSSGTVTGSVS